MISLCSVEPSVAIDTPSPLSQRQVVTSRAPSELSERHSPCGIRRLADGRSLQSHPIQAIASRAGRGLICRSGPTSVAGVVDALCPCGNEGAHLVSSYLYCVAARTRSPPVRSRLRPRSGMPSRSWLTRFQQPPRLVTRTPWQSKIPRRPLCELLSSNPVGDTN